MLADVSWRTTLHHDLGLVKRVSVCCWSCVGLESRLLTVHLPGLMGRSLRLPTCAATTIIVYVHDCIVILLLCLQNLNKAHDVRPSSYPTK
jgi:hypothetical protein